MRSYPVDPGHLDIPISIAARKDNQGTQVLRRMIPIIRDVHGAIGEHLLEFFELIHRLFSVHLSTFLAASSNNPSEITIPPNATISKISHSDCRKAKKEKGAAAASTSIPRNPAVGLSALGFTKNLKKFTTFSSVLARLGTGNRALDCRNQLGRYSR